MEYKKLGTTDIDVSTICLGTMTWGEQNSEADAHEQLDYAVSRGVNFIDTAELYAIPPKAETHGLTEKYIGSWLEKSGKRDQIILASKVVGPGEWVSYIRGGPRLNREQMTKALENSLQRLQTDYLDLYQIHWPERSTNFFGQLGYTPQEEPNVIPIEETLEVLNEFVQQGKVRHIGISNETPWGMMQYLSISERKNWPRIQSIQNPYSLLNRTFEIGLSEMAWHEKCGLLAYSPLGFGVLSGKYSNGKQPQGSRLALFKEYTRYSNPESVAATNAYVELAKTHGLSPAQMALAFINTRPFVSANIIGATTMDQLRENIESIDIELSTEVLEGIDAIHQRQPNPAP